MHQIFCLNRSPSRAVKDTRNITKWVMVLGTSFKTFVQAKRCGRIRTTVNQEDTADNILSCIVKNTSTNMSHLGLKVKGGNKGETKFPSPCRCNQILCAIHCCQNANCQEPVTFSQHFLPYNRANPCNE